MDLKSEMKKKQNVIKKIFIIIVSIIILFVLGIYLFITISDYMDYRASKKKVKEYVSKHYSNIDYHLVRSSMGKNAYPAERAEDEFIYYDDTNEFYFRIICYNSEKNISDNYEEAFEGDKITDHMQSTFTPDHYMMRCWVRDEERDSYKDSSCQIVYFTDSNDVDFKTLYDMYNLLAQNYPGIEISFMVSEAKNRKQYEDLFSYKKVVALEELPNIYYLEISTTEVVFKNADEFERFLSIY